ncbi:MAG: hypothetical protein R1F52_06140 [Candidatus Nitrosoabyssus spongiisocia]|nr:MAG: hypothetical protein R1F52_06140 [Nitrosopumilaceae archaeon AB1(1)]
MTECTRCGHDLRRHSITNDGFVDVFENNEMIGQLPTRTCVDCGCELVN